MVKDKSDKPQPQMPDQKRRQLLRGLGSVPVIATLTPVSASAASIVCTAKTQPDLPTGVTEVSNAPTTPTYTYWCTTTAQPSAVPPLQVTVNDPINSAVQTNVNVLSQGGNTAALGDTTYNGTAYQCVIYVDGSGNYTYSAASGNTRIGASCMLSLVNGAG